MDAYNTLEGTSIHKLHPRCQRIGYLVTAEEKTVHHAGDTDTIPEMGNLGKVDVALLPTGGTYTMDVDEDTLSVAIIKPKVAIPMHHIDADPALLAQKVGGRGGSPFSGLERR